jgi:hypothetical protein
MKMNKIILSSIVTALVATGVEADDIANALTKGKMTADLKAFYFDGERDNRTDREALAVGGIMKYESASYYGFSVGTAFYVSEDLLKLGYQTAQKGSIENGGSVNIVTKNIAGNTEMVNYKDGSGINSLAEAYIQYTLGKTTIKYGRQRLNTPLMNDYYNRFLPNTFEATLLTNKDLPQTELLGIYATRWKYKASDTFIDMTEGLGNPEIDSDVMVIGAINKSIPKTKLQAYYYMVPDLMNTFYAQIDNKVNIKDLTIASAFQYLDQRADGKEYLGDIDSYLAGAKVQLSYKGFSIKGMYDRVGDHTIRGSGTDYHTLGWSQFVNFTDIQIDGEALNAGAVSYGGVLGYKYKSLNTAIKYVRIDQDLQKQADGNTPNTRPSSDEYNLDIKYRINKASKLRVRLGYIDYESTHKNEFDEVNTRIIYDYNFTLASK